MLAKLLLFYLQTHMQKTPNNAALRNENNMWKWMSLSLIPHEKYSALNTTRKKKKKAFKKKIQVYLCGSQCWLQKKPTQED